MNPIKQTKSDHTPLNPKSPIFFEVYDITDESPTMAVGGDLMQLGDDDVQIALAKFKENAHEILLTHLFDFINENKNLNQIEAEVFRLICLSDKVFYQNGM